MIIKYINSNIKIKKIILLLLILLSIISIFKSFQDAKNLSFDLHLSPTQLVAEGQNHYQYVLDGKRDKGPNDRLLYSQDGVYGHGLFIILLPLTNLSWESSKLIWSFCNFFFIFLILFIFYRKIKLNFEHIIIISSIILCSTPFRLNIGYGQQTLMPIFFLFFALLYQNKFSIILSGISYIKYNIGYVLILHLLAIKNLKYLLLSAVTPLLFWLIYSFKTNTPLIESIFQPLQVLIYYQNNFKDNFPVTIFTLLDYFNIKSFSLIFPIILNFLVIKKFNSERDLLYKVSIISLSALTFASHQLHDYMLLIPLLIHSVINFKKFISKVNLLLVLYFFYLLRIYSLFFGTQPWEFPYGIFGYINNFLLFTVLILNLLNLFKNEKILYSIK